MQTTASFESPTTAHSASCQSDDFEMVRMVRGKGDTVGALRVTIKAAADPVVD